MQAACPWSLPSLGQTWAWSCRPSDIYCRLWGSFFKAFSVNGMQTSLTASSVSCGLRNLITCMCWTSLCLPCLPAAPPWSMSAPLYVQHAFLFLRAWLGLSSWENLDFLPLGRLLLCCVLSVLCWLIDFFNAGTLVIFTTDGDSWRQELSRVSRFFSLPWRLDYATRGLGGFGMGGDWFVYWSCSLGSSRLHRIIP